MLSAFVIFFAVISARAEPPPPVLPQYVPRPTRMRLKIEELEKKVHTFEEKEQKEKKEEEAQRAQEAAQEKQRPAIELNQSVAGSETAPQQNQPQEDPALTRKRRQDSQIAIDDAIERLRRQRIKKKTDD